MDKLIGKRLDGRYEIREIVGIGGMAIVYRGYDIIENKKVAVKVLKDEYARDEEFKQRFKNESRAIALLSHQNIVKIYDVSFGDIMQYIVMEYVDGITLKDFIEKKKKLSYQKTLEIIIQILKALQHAHDKGIIHRDVKPQNIILTKDNEIKVTDFGIAIFSRNKQATITDSAIGTVYYISPEQAKGMKSDERSDLYSVGVIMYEMLTGIMPFRGESAVAIAMMQLQNDPIPLRDIDPVIPLGISQITLIAMQKDPMKRYQSATEMIYDLETFKRDPSAVFSTNNGFSSRSSRKDDDLSKTKVKRINYIDNNVNKTDTTDNKPKDKQDKNKKNSGSKVITIVTALSVLLASLIAIFFIYVIVQKVNSTNNELECPNFEGMTISEINKKYDTTNYNFDIIEKETTSVRENEVISQKPLAGTKIKSKDKITLTIATGLPLEKVPDISGDTEALAMQTLKNSGFTNITIKKTYDDTIEKDKAVKTSPGKNSVINISEEIILYISKGKEIIEIDVPDLYGNDEDTARKLLENKKLKLGNISEIEASEPKGYIVQQSVAAGTKVEVGTSVDIVLSSGSNSASKYFSTKVEIELPQNCKFQTGYIITEDSEGKRIESELLNFKEDKSYSFTANSKEESDYFIVKIMDNTKKDEYDYQKVVVNYAESSFEVDKNYDEYPKK